MAADGERLRRRKDVRPQALWRQTRAAPVYNDTDGARFDALSACGPVAIALKEKIRVDGAAPQVISVEPIKKGARLR